MTRFPSAPDRQADLAPATATARLREQSEHLAWLAYVRTLALQEAEPGRVTTIIRNATYDVWKRVYLAEDDGGQP